MWLGGTMPVSSVQAERHGPSITTRSPLSRICSYFWTKEETSPPGSLTMRTSADAVDGITIEDATNIMKADASAPAKAVCHFILTSPFPLQSLPTLPSHYGRSSGI